VIQCFPNTTGAAALKPGICQTCGGLQEEPLKIVIFWAKMTLQDISSTIAAIGYAPG
jgi:hypothetical protein